MTTHDNDNDNDGRIGIRFTLTYIGCMTGFFTVALGTGRILAALFGWH